MSHHPSYTMAVICAIGGISAYSKAGSIPSLIAGVGIGTLYGIAGYAIKENKDYGHETALGVLSVGVGVYYAKKIYEYR